MNMAMGLMVIGMTVLVSAFALFNEHAERKQEEARRDFIRKTLQGRNT